VTIFKTKQSRKFVSMARSVGVQSYVQFFEPVGMKASLKCKSLARPALIAPENVLVLWP